MNRKPDIAQKFRAIVLLLILLAPMLIQGLHRHKQTHCCIFNNPVGLNSLLPHHSVKSCHICNFQYVQVIAPVDCHLPEPASTSFILLYQKNQSEAKSDTCFASLRAPPLA
ncbi:MAG: hypothetical protein V1775_17265 [Bacteroidota bacterium]